MSSDLPTLMAPGAPPLILASGSATRAAMLRAAGVAITVRPAAVDEAAIKESLHAEGADPAQAALTLAGLKAERIGRQHPGMLIIGADQMLACDGVWHDKPEDPAAAASQLRQLAGRTHDLHSAAVVWRDGTVLWQHSQRARLTLRPLGDAFLAAYLAVAGNSVLGSVGAYQLEGLGAQLFAKVEGDPYAILGLPMLPLLGFLRDHGALLR